MFATFKMDLPDCSILLNKAEEDGYIVVTLVNKNKEYITLMAKIDHTKKKVVYRDSINFGIEEGSIETQRLNEVLNEYNNWKDNITDFNIIKYNMNEFGVYYYISQAESVHFLKKNMSERKSTLDALLEVGDASKWSDFVKEELIGKTKLTKGVLINEEIERVNRIIKEDGRALKECYQKAQDNEPVKYAPIMLCDEVLYWDEEKLDNFSENDLNRGLSELNRLSLFAKDYDDYEKYVWNSRLEAAIKPSVISDMLLCIPYLSGNGKLEISKVNHFLEEQDKIIEVYNRSFIRLDKLETIREKLNSLCKIYDKSIEQYKNQVLKKLRVPLLIYTAKILQDYQNGLGVFINKDEMRFVPNCDAKLDILNTFSSGQLSGFVLAFLFSMNKQYIKESEDDLGFILIDDPVQTMDDINISSMIEVLRNDFSTKQIIMSTHEMDKENYILYKFYKYNIVGQSFNVKDKLYGLQE